jgi:hypothetical protein
VGIAVLLAAILEVLVGPGIGWALLALTLLGTLAFAVSGIMVGVGSFWARFDWIDARRMMHPIGAFIGLFAELVVTLLAGFFVVTAFIASAFLRVNLGVTLSLAVVTSAVVSLVLAYAAYVVGSERLRTLDVG